MGQDANLQGVWGGLSEADRRRIRDGKPPVEPKTTTAGECGCGRPVPGTGSDRLRGGMCQACYRRQARQTGRVA